MQLSHTQPNLDGESVRARWSAKAAAIKRKTIQLVRFPAPGVRADGNWITYVRLEVLDCEPPRLFAKPCRYQPGGRNEGYGRAGYRFFWMWTWHSQVNRNAALPLYRILTVSFRPFKPSVPAARTGLSGYRTHS